MVRIAFFSRFADRRGVMRQRLFPDRGEADHPGPVRTTAEQGAERAVFFAATLHACLTGTDAADSPRTRPPSDAPPAAAIPGRGHHDVRSPRARYGPRRSKTIVNQVYLPQRGQHSAGPRPSACVESVSSVNINGAAGS